MLLRIFVRNVYIDIELILSVYGFLNCALTSLNLVSGISVLPLFELQIGWFKYNSHYTCKSYL
jgi:hypothetical protein